MAGLRWCGELGEDLAREIARGDHDDTFASGRGINLEAATYLPPELIKRLVDTDRKLRAINEKSVIDKRREMIMKRTNLSVEEVNRILQEES